MERKRIIQLACEVGFCNLRNEHWDCHTEQIEAFAKLVAAHEREALLDLVDNYAKNNTDLKAAIRARK